MKNIFFVLTLALAASLPSHAATPSQLATSSRSDNACMVRHVLASPASPQAQQQAVATCVTFERGAAAWYLSQNAARGKPVDTQSPAAQEFLRNLRSLSSAYLAAAMTQCNAAGATTEARCLQVLNLPAD